MKSQDETKMDMAFRLGIERRTLYDWISEGMPIGSNIHTIIAWCYAHRKRGGLMKGVVSSQAAAWRQEWVGIKEWDENHYWDRHIVYRERLRKYRASLRDFGFCKLCVICGSPICFDERQPSSKSCSKECSTKLKILSKAFHRSTAKSYWHDGPIRLIMKCWRCGCLFKPVSSDKCSICCKEVERLIARQAAIKDRAVGSVSYGKFLFAKKTSIKISEVPDEIGELRMLSCQLRRLAEIKERKNEETGHIVNKPN